MNSSAVTFSVFVDPVGGVRRFVEARQWVLPVVLLALALAASGAAIALRTDASRGVISKLSESGELSKKSEREISEAVEQAQRVALVAGVGRGVLVPMGVGLLAIALRIVAWLLGRETSMGACFSAAAVAMLPIALFHLILGAAAWSQAVVTPTLVPSLVPSTLSALITKSPPISRVLDAFDFFNVWSAVLLGLGFGVATKLRAPLAVALGLFLYVLFAAVVIVAIPGMGGRS